MTESKTTKSPKCYGSTSVSKTERDGSIPSGGANPQTTKLAGKNYCGIPEDAIEVVCKGFCASPECIGVWKDKDGTLYISGYHYGPSGDLMFKIKPDGDVQ